MTAKDWGLPIILYIGFFVLLIFLLPDSLPGLRGIWRRTLGAIFGGLIYLCLGLAIGGFLIAKMIRMPPKEQRNPEWSIPWIIIPLMVASMIGASISYEPGPRGNSLQDSVLAIVRSVVGWFFS